jgi:hypothetical protein
LRGDERGAERACLKTVFNGVRGWLGFIELNGCGRT